MKAITDPTKLPKFLVCNEIPERDWSWNKHLPKPWTKGEIVKVQPAETQKHDPTYDHIHPRVKPYTDEEFRERFVRIIRKDSVLTLSQLLQQVLQLQQQLFQL